MPYTPTDWVDGVTPVDASRLDKIEAGIVASEEKALKAQANGYASLDSGGKVPLAQLPPVGADLAYNGAWVPTSYEDGDIVIGADNVAYMCVTPTNTAPEPWPGGPTPLPVATIPYGTSLPPSPADGQEAILVDSVTIPQYTWRFRYNAQSVWGATYAWEYIGGSGAGQSLPTAPRHGVEFTLVDNEGDPSYQWQFRYNAASSSPYKWEFVGGPPRVQWEATEVGLGASDTSFGPTIVLPRSGDYAVQISGALYGPAGSYISYGVAYYASGPYVGNTSTHANAGTTMATSYVLNQRINALDGGSSISVRMSAPAAAVTSRHRQIQAIPVRVA